MMCGRTSGQRVCALFFPPRMTDNKINRRSELVISSQDRVDLHECTAFVLEQTSSTSPFSLSNRREKMPE